MEKNSTENQMPVWVLYLGYGSIPLEKIRPGLEQLQKACDELKNVAMPDEQLVAGHLY